MKRKRTLSQDMAAFLGMAVVKKDNRGVVSVTILPITRLSILSILIWQLVWIEAVSRVDVFLNFTADFYLTFNAGFGLLAGLGLQLLGCRL